MRFLEAVESILTTHINERNCGHQSEDTDLACRKPMRDGFGYFAELHAWYIGSI